MNHHARVADTLTATLILAGGTGVRVGGINKPFLEVAGRTLLEWTLEYVPAERVILIAPDDVATLPGAEGLERVVEDPPLSGPMAGFVAGCRYLANSRLSDLGLCHDARVGLIPVDAPLSGRALAVLDAAIAMGEPWSGASVVLASVDGYRHPVVGVWRLDVALTAAAELERQAKESGRAPRRSMKALLDVVESTGGTVVNVEVDPILVDDIDTPEDAIRVERRLTSGE